MFTSNDHFDVLDITQDKTRKMTHTVEQIKKLMGSPRNYGKCKKMSMVIKDGWTIKPSFDASFARRIRNSHFLFSLYTHNNLF